MCIKIHESWHLRLVFHTPDIKNGKQRNHLSCPQFEHIRKIYLSSGGWGVLWTSDAQSTKSFLFRASFHCFISSTIRIIMFVTCTKTTVCIPRCWHWKDMLKNLEMIRALTLKSQAVWKSRFSFQTRLILWNGQQTLIK